MLRLCCKVTIEGGSAWEFTSVASCAITEDTESLTDTCVIELPKKAKWEGQPVGAGGNPPVKRGDRITVQLGYDGDDNLKTRFVGYVRRVSAATPVKLECEDGMFMLKLAAAQKKGFKEVTLGALIGTLLEGTGVRHTLIDKDMKLGPYRITQDTVAKELAELQRTTGLMAYFRNMGGEPTLYVGFTYPFDGRKKESFLHGHNIISSGLEYSRKEDVKLKVKAVSIQPDNKRIAVEVGDKDGELRTVYKYNVQEGDLKVFAAAELERFKYDGYQGSFETFGEPAVSKTDVAHVEGEDGNKGNFLIKKVEIKFGADGYRQKIELGPTVG
jgi:hypothetical protein